MYRRLVCVSAAAEASNASVHPSVRPRFAKINAEIPAPLRSLASLSLVFLHSLGTY